MNSIKSINCEIKIYKKKFEADLWFLIFIKAKIKDCNSTRKTHIFGKEMVISWPDFYADHDGTNGFWKFWGLDQNNPLYKFDTFWANISVYVLAYGPKFDLMDSFSTLLKMNWKVMENYKVLQNLGITFESRQCGIWYTAYEMQHMICGIW